MLLVTGMVFGETVFDPPIAGSPRKAKRRRGLVLSWSWITSVFLIDVAGLILASHLPIPAPPAVALQGDLVGLEDHASISDHSDIGQVMCDLEGIDDRQHGGGLGLIALERLDRAGRPATPISAPVVISKAIDARESGQVVIVGPPQFPAR